MQGAERYRQGVQIIPKIHQKCERVHMQHYIANRNNRGKAVYRVVEVSLHLLYLDL
jgi:hypothetical protein